MGQHRPITLDAYGLSEPAQLTPFATRPLDPPERAESQWHDMVYAPDGAARELGRTSQPDAHDRAVGLAMMRLTILGMCLCGVAWAVDGPGLAARLLAAGFLVLFGSIWSFSRG